MTAAVPPAPRRPGVALAALATLLAGCSVAPPAELAQDPELAPLAGAADLRGARLAVALPTLGRDLGGSRPGEPLPADGLGTVAPVTTARGAASGLEPRYGWRAPRPPEGWVPAAAREVAWSPDAAGLEGVRRALHDGLVAAAGHALAGGGSPARVGPVGPLELAAVQDREGEAAPDLVLALDVRAVHAAWVDRGALWWLDAGLFWIGGVLPIVFVPDETFEVALLGQLELVDARSGRVLRSAPIVARAEDTLNDPQRGWSLSGLLFLYPWTLEPEDLEPVWEALWPHARREVERAAARFLVEASRGDLTAPAPAEAPAGPAGADPAAAKPTLRGRTFALVIGHDGPPPLEGGPAPLQGAVVDARALARHLDRSDVNDPARLTLLTGAAATPEAVLDAVAALGRAVGPEDRLVVAYAGYGATDLGGAPALVLGERPLPLRALADAAAKHVRGAVVWVLDTSFQGAGGRTYPGAPGRGDPLAALARPRWGALAACGPGEVATELGDRPGGAFTTRLLAGLAGAADADGDGAVDLREAETYLRTWLPAEVRERVGAAQTPRAHVAGVDAGAPAPHLARVPRPDPLD